jgi:glycosyltransferase involved in cell wall biosynthesis
MSALPLDVIKPASRDYRLKRSEILVVTSWYPTNAQPFIYPFINDHIGAWTEYLFEDDGCPVAVIHPKEALSVLAAIRHGSVPLRGVTRTADMKVVRTQSWRLQRRWSQADLGRETRALKDALTAFPWFDNRPPRLIVAQTLSAARQALALRDANRWSSPVVLIEHSSPLALQFQVPAAEPHQRRALAEVDAVIAVSHNLAQSVSLERGKRNLFVIPNPVDERAFATPYPDEWTGGRLRLVNVGFCTPQKAQDVLIESVAVLESKGVDAELEIVGDGPQFSRLVQLIDQRRLGDRVTLRGSLPREGVLDALSRAHMFVFPSRWENCPVALQEAQAVGLPIVVTENGASERILVHPDHKICPVDDVNALAAAIELLARSPRAYTPEERRAEARLRFSREQFAQQCNQVFSGVIAMAENEESLNIRSSV